MDTEGDWGVEVGSMFNEGIWNPQRKTWEGSAIPRTMEHDDAHYTAFLLGMHSFPLVAVCSGFCNCHVPGSSCAFCT